VAGHEHGAQDEKADEDDGEVLKELLEREELMQ
jgi:hypothetical protein